MEKTQVYIANIQHLNIEKSYEKIPAYRRKKVDNFSRIEDKKLSIGVFLLLCKALELNGLNINDFKFKEKENGKPYFEDSNLHFSYSHSGDYCAVALSDNPVGIDIQKIKNIDQNIAHLIFNQKDEDFFSKTTNKNDALNKIWVLKEAIAKIEGYINFKNIIIDYSDFNIEKINDYYLAIAPHQNYTITKIEL